MSDALDDGSWLREELAGSTFRDERLGQRMRKLISQMARAVGDPLPMACQDWASTKAAYRFLSNASVSEREILGGHFEATSRRVAHVEGFIFVLQDTTEFIYRRENAAAIGFTKSVNSGRDKEGRLRHHTTCGLLMHSSLAITPEGLPLGLAAAKFWTRSKFKGTAQLKRLFNQTRVPIEGKESIRWLNNMRESSALLGDPGRLVHIGDRENDIYEFFCAAQEIGTHFLVRTCANRLAGEGKHTVATEMAAVEVQGLHAVAVADRTIAMVTLKYKHIRVLPPIGKQKRYPALNLTIIHAKEEGAPEGRAPLDWKLITDLPVNTPEEAAAKLNWYAMRWKIEVFHKILKSGCRAEEARLRTAERLVNLIALFCILSWRIFWLTMINRAAPEAAPTIALTSQEVDLLKLIATQPRKHPPPLMTLNACLIQIAKLGGYLARASDPPPGNMVMWRGWARLMDIKLGVQFAKTTYG